MYNKTRSCIKKLFLSFFLFVQTIYVYKKHYYIISIDYTVISVRYAEVI